MKKPFKKIPHSFDKINILILSKHQFYYDLQKLTIIFNNSFMYEFDEVGDFNNILL